MRLKYTFELVDMADEIIAVPVGKDSSDLQGIIKLNKEGAEILSLLNKDTSIDEIVNALSIKYENNRDELKVYAKQVLDILKKNDLLFE